MGADAYEARYRLYEAVARDEGLDGEAIDYLEFGVFRGASLKWWVQRNSNPESRFTGFDTFTGLPEDWIWMAQGTFSTEGKPPEIDDERCGFQVGLFQKTLPRFLETFAGGRRMVVHLDADLYSATLFALTSIGSRLKRGDLLFFDDFDCPLHEFRAFDHFIAGSYARYELLGAVDGYGKICIKILGDALGDTQ